MWKIGDEKASNIHFLQFLKDSLLESGLFACLHLTAKIKESIPLEGLSVI
jgi:hypothetical protein